jgi:hypothetical protein
MTWLAIAGELCQGGRLAEGLAIPQNDYACSVLNYTKPYKQGIGF